MQKKLIALAIAGAFAAPAFAATSNVDVYGLMNVAFDRVDNGAETRNAMVSNNNSALGVKGSEDLGGGMKATWQIEMNLAIDNSNGGGNLWGTRNTFVGLGTKSMGEVRFGTHDTPYKSATGPLDIFVGTLGDYNTIFGASCGTSAKCKGGDASNMFDLRTANTIAYLSPDFSGLSFAAAYVMGEAKGSTGDQKPDAYSLAGTYKNGPLFVTAAYEKHNKFNSATCSSATSIGTDGCAQGATNLVDGSSTADRDAWKIGVGYTIGSLKLGAVYESIDSDLTGTSAIDRDAWGVSAAYTMGALTFKGSYAQADDAGSTTNTAAKMWAVGADYALSKRTTIQATYANLNNDTAGNYVLGQGVKYNNSGTGSAADLDGFQIGIKHTF